jgi:hypothetical protein
LVGIGGAVPADKEAELAFEKLRELVEGDQIMRLALVSLLVSRILDAAEIEQAPVRQAPAILLRIKPVARVEDLTHPVGHRAQLLGLAPEQDRALMFQQRQPDQQIRLPAPRRAAIKQKIRRTGKGQFLRCPPRRFGHIDQRTPRIGRQILGQQCINRVALRRRQIGIGTQKATRPVRHDGGLLNLIADFRWGDCRGVSWRDLRG